MKKYKLIKLYPNCPFNIGSEVVYCPELGEYWINGKINHTIKKDDVEAYPEFWKEIKNPEYEILDKTYIPRHKCSGAPELMWEIISIKRLLDNEIFTIGDKINFEGTVKTITEISLNPNPDNKPYKRAVPYLVCGPSYGISLDIAEKAELLFTTEDGVDIYEGDTVYFIRNDFRTLRVFERKKYFGLPHHGNIYFSTKEKAEKYIEINQPRFSKNDVENIINNNLPKIGTISFWSYVYKLKTAFKL